MTRQSRIPPATPALFSPEPLGEQAACRLTISLAEPAPTSGIAAGNPDRFSLLPSALIRTLSVLLVVANHLLALTA